MEASQAFNVPIYCGPCRRTAPHVLLAERRWQCLGCGREKGRNTCKEKNRCKQPQTAAS